MEKTIAAISTAMSASGIGIIRISGPQAMEILEKIYRSKGGKKKIKEMPTHTIHYGYIYDEEKLVDEVLVMLMYAPRTFTGEDTVEIDCHGGVYACRRVLETVLKNGAKIAEPGEFTKRAFLNGRLDLSQAEAVMDVIEAKTALCGTKAGADMQDGLRINGVRHDRQYVTQPDLKAGGVAFYNGVSASPEVTEQIIFAKAILGEGSLVVLPEQAACVTRILDAIYESARIGKPVYFE